MSLPMMYWPTERPYEALEVTRGDMNLASIAFGWTLGFGYFAGCHAVRETRRTHRLRPNTYIVLIWGELVVCLVFAILCWLYLAKIIPPSFYFYFFILTTWALQVQFLLQIIVNRLCILLPNNYTRNWLRWGIACIILSINISVYCIWLPAKLQISDRYRHINLWWDRCEKVMYLVVDAALNYYFIRTVKVRLVSHGGLKKYQKLVRFNTQIVFVSLSMDVLIIAMMWLRNDFVYMQFHPVAYIVKLNIEMAMSNLIIKVARETGIHVAEEPGSDTGSGIRFATMTAPLEVQVQVARQQFTTRDDGQDIELGPVWRARKSESADSISLGRTSCSVDIGREGLH